MTFIQERVSTLEQLKKKAREDMATHREQGIAGGHGPNAYSPEQYDWVDTLIEQVWNARGEEVLRLIDKHDPNVKMGRETNPYYWGNTLREELKATLTPKISNK